MTTNETTGIHSGSRTESTVPMGGWRVDPSRSSALFTARLVGRRVQGRLPLTGGAIVAASIEDSTAQLTAMTEAVTTGHALIDELLAGPGFLDAGTFPEISFRSEMLVCVPTGWRAIGRLRVKGTEHPLVCELDADLRHPQAGVASMTLTSRWVLDSTWITTQRVPALSRRIAMTCSVELDLTDPLPIGPAAAA
jgi:polyisoprenoid-binding protein YceI